jgi:hypothetical protein
MISYNNNCTKSDDDPDFTPEEPLLIKSKGSLVSGVIFRSIGQGRIKAIQITFNYIKLKKSDFCFDFFQKIKKKKS